MEGEGAYVNSIILTELMTKTPFLFLFFVQESEQKERRGVWCWLRLLKVGQENPNGQIDRSSLCLFFSFLVLFTSPCP